MVNGDMLRGSDIFTFVREEEIVRELLAGLTNELHNVYGILSQIYEGGVSNPDMHQSLKISKNNFDNLFGKFSAYLQRRQDIGTINVDYYSNLFKTVEDMFYKVERAYCLSYKVPKHMVDDIDVYSDDVRRLKNLVIK